MTFWAYMLHCRGGAFYVGHTNNLDQRIAQHRAGELPGFTQGKLPVELVWSESFPTRIEALEAERRIKGWSRAKKLALIRGDWDQISALARSKNRPSTGSGRTGMGADGHPKPDACNHEPDRPEPEEEQCWSAPHRNRVLRKSPLYPHPATPAPDIMLAHYFHVTPEGRLTVSYVLRTDPAILNLPDPVPNPQRRDGLWHSTCFEAFIRIEGEESYRELNFAPSGDWAAYRFSGYREGMASEKVDEPPVLVIEPYEFGRLYRYTLAAPWLADLRRWHVALTAVIEDREGGISYWSMHHPPGPPDFHHADNYARILGAPGEQL